jgi:hypothetical protein
MTHDSNFSDTASMSASSSAMYPQDVKVRPPESPQGERAAVSDFSSSQPGSSTSSKMHIVNDPSYATSSNVGSSSLQLPMPTTMPAGPSSEGGSQLNPDLAAVLDVISRARLSPREMQVVTTVSNRLAPETSAPAAPAPAPATMGLTMEEEPTSEAPPPPYAF